MNQRIAALGVPQDDPIAIASHVEQVHVIIGEALTSLRLVAVPPGEEAEIAAVYATFAKVLKDAPAYPAALRARNQQAAEAARKQLAADRAQAKAAAIRYGMTACGT
jgi:hypothetical protein